MNRFRICLLGILTLVGANAQPSTNRPLFGVTQSGNQLITINPSTGSSRPIGQLSAGTTANGLSSRYGFLYSFNAGAGQILQIDPRTGQTTDTIPLAGLGAVSSGSFTVDSSGRGIVAATPLGLPVPSNLYDVDVVTGQSTLIGVTDINVEALTVGDDGRLLALANGNLYSLNRTNGQSTVIGSTGITSSGGRSSIGFGANGNLYAVINDQLFQVNTNSGAATVTTGGNNIGFTQVSGVSTLQQEANADIYGISFFRRELFKVNPSTGMGMLVGTNASMIRPIGLAARNGVLYTFDTVTDKLLAIDPGTGNTTATNDVHMEDVEGEGDLAFRSDGIGFLTVSFKGDGTPIYATYTLDPDAGTSTLINLCTNSIDGLAFSPSDQLYALEQTSPKLWLMNQTSGIPTEVGNLGITPNSPFAGMTFDRDGRLLAAIDDRLYTISTNTGAATVVDANVLDLGFSSVSGLASFEAPSLQIVEENDRFVLFWNDAGATLESSAAVDGPFTTAPKQDNPQVVEGTGNMFFRLRRQ